MTKNNIKVKMVFHGWSKAENDLTLHIGELPGRKKTLVCIILTGE